MAKKQCPPHPDKLIGTETRRASDGAYEYRSKCFACGAVIRDWHQ